VGIHPKLWNVNTLFFSHFSVTFSERDMGRIFPRWGRVHEVLISRKVNRWGQKFRFVRFIDMKNVRSLEHELNAIIIGTIKLHVNLLRYSKRDTELRISDTKRNTGVSRDTNIPGKVDNPRYTQHKELKV